MTATARDRGSNQPGDTYIFGNDGRALAVVIVNDDGSLPSGAGGTQLNVSSANVANAAATATLAALAAKTNFLTGFECTGSGSTSGGPVTLTITGILGGTLNYTVTAAVGALLPNQPLQVEFNPPLQASAVNVAIVVSCPALGAGNTNNTVVAHGYRQ